MSSAETTTDLIRKMLRSGARPRQIAEELEVSQQRVCNIRRRMGLAPQPRRKLPIEGPAHWYG